LDGEQFFSTVRLLLVVGKGGVGKTSVAATLAVAAARTGRSVLVADVDGRHGAAAAFGVHDLSYAERVLVPASKGRGAIAARTLTADDALVEYLADHGMGRLAKKLASNGVVDVIATATPGIKDLLVLGKVKQLVSEARHDLVILDTPASGHAVTFLRSAGALAQSVSSGRIRRQADEVLEVLGDHDRTRVVLVTIAEETPVNETIETAFTLEDEVGVALAPVVINAVLDVPAPVPAGALARLDPAERAAVTGALSVERARAESQQTQLARLAKALPLAQVVLPERPGTRLVAADFEALADSFTTSLADAS
jgi:anion-transporting  ArsA/GET3 family ATPase